MPRKGDKMRRAGICAVWVLVLVLTMGGLALAGAGPPTAPVDMLAIGGPEAVSLSWLPGGDSEAQVLYRYAVDFENNRAGYWFPIATLGPLESSYQDTAAEAGAVYGYCVMARNYSGQYRGASSKVDSAGLGTGIEPFPPIYVRVRSYSMNVDEGEWAHVFTVKGTAISTKAESYELYRSLEGGPFEWVGTMAQSGVYLSCSDVVFSDSPDAPFAQYYILPVTYGPSSVPVP